MGKGIALLAAANGQMKMPFETQYSDSRPFVDRPFVAEKNQMHYLESSYFAK